MDDCMIHAQFESNLMWPREVRFRSTTEVYQGAEKVSWGFSLLLGSSAHQDRIVQSRPAATPLSCFMTIVSNAGFPAFTIPFSAERTSANDSG